MNSEGTQSYVYTNPFPLDSPVIQPAASCWAEFPVLFSRPLLVTYFKYGSVYMSIPNSLTIPSRYPSPRNQSLFSKSLFLFCKFIEIMCTSWLKIKIAIRKCWPTSFSRESFVHSFSKHVLNPRHWGEKAAEDDHCLPVAHNVVGTCVREKQNNVIEVFWWENQNEVSNFGWEY